MSFAEQKKDLSYYLKKISKALKSLEPAKFDDLISMIMKSIRIIYGNPDKLLYNIHSFSVEAPILIKEGENGVLSKEFKENNQNKLLKLVVKVIYGLIRFIRNPRFGLFSPNQKFIYMHLMRHFLKESLFEIPLPFKSRFSEIFKLELSEYFSCDHFYILRSLLLEIGDYEVINWELQKGTLHSLAHGFIYFIKALEKDKIVDLGDDFDESFENQIKKWLLSSHEASEVSYTSKYSLTNLTSLFKKQSLKPLKDIDNETVIDFFTVYNIKEEYSSVFWYSFKVFSMIYVWLSQILRNIQAENPLKSQKNIFSSLSFEAKEVIISYCLRLFAQSERKIEGYKQYKEKNIFIQLHKEYNEAVIGETIKVLNILCKIDSSLIPKILDYVMEAYERILKNQSGLSFLDFLQFLLDHELNILVDFEKPFKEFFCLHINNNYNNLILINKTMEFLLRNKEILYSRTNVYNEYYPSIFRMLIWSPLQLKENFLELMSYFITKEAIIHDSIDLFHFLLDLPLMSALIEFMDKYWEFCHGNIVSIFDPEFSEIVEYIFRLSSPRKTILFYDKNEAKKLETLSNSLSKTSRTIAVCEISPEILSKYLSLFIEKMPSENIIVLTVDMFLRFSRIYDNQDYKQKVREIILIYLEKIFKNIPEIIFLVNEKILERISNFEEIENRELILNLCWAVGEFIQNDTIITEINLPYAPIEIANKYCDSLEIVIHEMIKDLIEQKKEEDFNWDYNNPQHLYLIKLVQIIINALMKLAIKFKEFIPKVVLIFSKILAQKDVFRPNILSKVEESLTLIHYTGISSVLFCGNDLA